MDYGSLMFLPSRIMPHLFIQLNTNTGYNSGSVLVLLILGDTGRGGKQREFMRGGRSTERMVRDKAMGRCDCVCAGWRHLKGGLLGRQSLWICLSVSPLISSRFCKSEEGSASPLFCFDSVTRADCRAVPLDYD